MSDGKELAFDGGEGTASSAPLHAHNFMADGHNCNLSPALTDYVLPNGPGRAEDVLDTLDIAMCTGRVESFVSSISPGLEVSARARLQLLHKAALMWTSTGACAIRRHFCLQDIHGRSQHVWSSYGGVYI
jgi:hypothetical protein